MQLLECGAWVIEERAVNVGEQVVITEGECLNNPTGFRYHLYHLRGVKVLSRQGFDTLGQCQTMAWHLATPMPAFEEDCYDTSDLAKLRRLEPEPECHPVSGRWMMPGEDTLDSFDN